MKTILRKLLVGVAGLVIESLSISKEQITHQRQQKAALRRVHQCERELSMANAAGNAEAISNAQGQLNASRTAFSQIYS